MNDEEMKNKILDGVQKLADKWKKESTFTEPRPRWFTIGKMKYKKDKQEVHYASPY